MPSSSSIVPEIVRMHAGDREGDQAGLFGGGADDAQPGILLKVAVA